MRLWTIHPKYLDTKGLLALWREALLAKHVLEGRTKGYKNHPQLARFKNAQHSLCAINCYLLEVYNEALARGYNFDRSKIGPIANPCRIKTTTGQIDCERMHLHNKLLVRDPLKAQLIFDECHPAPHPIFLVETGDVEEWEKNRKPLS